MGVLLETAAPTDGSVPARPSTLRFLVSPWTALVVAAGLLVRLWIINTGNGILIADEAYTGLQSAAVLDGRFPVVIDGLNYTAPFDSYLLAPITAIVGQHVVVLKLYPSVAWALTAVLVVALTRRLASDRAAALAGAMTWLAPGSLAVVATRGYQSYASGMAAVTATALAVVVLLTADDEGDRPPAWRSALVGALAGFTFYLHPMYLAALIPVVAVPCWRYRTEGRRWWAPAVAAAVVVNGPFLAWNAKNGWPSLEQPAAATDGPLDRFLRFGTGLVPRAYGVRSQAGDWIFGRPLSILLVLALAAAALAGAARLVRRDRVPAAVVVGPLALGWVLMAGFTNTAFVLDGRYAIITFPFVVIAVAVGVVSHLPTRSGVVALAASAWLLVFAVPQLLHDNGTDLFDPNEQYNEVVALLDERGIERVSGTYWWVLPVEVLSDQRIRSSVAGNPYVVLLPLTQRLVESSPAEDVAFVLWKQGDDPNLLRMPVDRYDRIDVGDAVVYVPTPG